MYGGKNLWDCEMSADVKKDGNVTEFLYALKDGLCVKNTVKEYPDFDAYEWVTWFENTGSEPSGVISELWDADIEIPFEHKEPTAVSAFIPDSDSDTKVIVPSGSTWVKDEFYCDIDKYNQSGFVNHIYPGQTKRYAASGGRSSENTAPFFNIFEKGHGVIGAIGWTGQWSCEISRAEDSVRIKTGIEDAEFRLHPGEKIRTSSFVIMSYEGDITESQNKWRRLAKKHFSLIGAEGRDKYAPLCAGMWGGMSTDGMLDRIKKIKDFGLPFEYIWIDAGWYGTADGDGAWAAVQYNRPEEKDGMIQVFRRAKSPYTTENFTLRGLNADGTYMFTDADGSEFEISGRELIENGLNISIKEKRTAKIYFYKMI